MEGWMFLIVALVQAAIAMLLNATIILSSLLYIRQMPSKSYLSFWICISNFVMASSILTVASTNLVQSPARFSSWICSITGAFTIVTVTLTAQISFAHALLRFLILVRNSRPSVFYIRASLGVSLTLDAVMGIMPNTAHGFLLQPSRAYCSIDASHKAPVSRAVAIGTLISLTTPIAFVGYAYYRIFGVVSHTLREVGKNESHVIQTLDPSFPITLLGIGGRATPFGAECGTTPELEFKTTDASVPVQQQQQSLDRPKIKFEEDKGTYNGEVDPRSDKTIITEESLTSSVTLALLSQSSEILTNSTSSPHQPECNPKSGNDSVVSVYLRDRSVNSNRTSFRGRSYASSNVGYSGLDRLAQLFSAPEGSKQSSASPGYISSNSDKSRISRSSQLSRTSQISRSSQAGNAAGGSTGYLKRAASHTSVGVVVGEVSKISSRRGSCLIGSKSMDTFTSAQHMDEFGCSLVADSNEGIASVEVSERDKVLERLQEFQKRATTSSSGQAKPRVLTRVDSVDWDSDEELTGKINVVRLRVSFSDKGAQPANSSRTTSSALLSSIKLGASTLKLGSSDTLEVPVSSSPGRRLSSTSEGTAPPTTSDRRTSMLSSAREVDLRRERMVFIQSSLTVASYLIGWIPYFVALLYQILSGLAAPVWLDSAAIFFALLFCIAQPLLVLVFDDEIRGNLSLPSWLF
ncbi:hypothetical protein BC830DRAFT_549069 [Chytriomyces sp. MP71]|nr:hypothetical protein BC830DRAFT_549069 [Chytriomyces sp. MP71]